MQTDPITLRSLADEVERAEGPSRELDARIFAAVDPDKVPSPVVESGYGWRYDRGLWWLATGEDARTPPKTVSPPHFTSSIDAAMTLVPPGYTWGVFDNGDAWVWPDERRDLITGYQATKAPTPAQALAAAALRARAEMMEMKDG